MISPENIRKGLQTKIMGLSIICLDETTSTNDYARTIASEGAIEGTVVLAETQTAGRGRLGRHWHSPRGGVWMSIVLRPPSNRPLQKTTLLSGLSVAQTLRELFKIDAVLKWPNDVLVRNKKIGGILTEGSFIGSRLLFVLVGIGINANVSLDTLPVELRNETSSLKAILGRNISLERLVRRVLMIMDRNYDLFVEGKDERLWLEYEKLCKTIGSEVRVETGNGEVIEGLALGISLEGGLILRTRDGSKRTILSGDCLHLRVKT